MIRTNATNEPHDSSWVEALHAAIAAETPAVCEHTPAISPEEFDEVRDCLHLLNRLRQEQRTSGERPRKIGRFKIVREVGRGGFGVVLAAVDPRVGRQVAIKIPRPEVLATHATRSRFLREARAAGALSHPNLIAIHEVGEDGPVCYIVSELCHGTNLAQWLAARETQPNEREAAETLTPLARAVAHAHRRGVLHRDIKPSNVLLEPSEPGLAGAAAVEGLNFRPLLTDFGLARISEFMEEHTCTGTLLGTPAYMAPEQAEGRINTLGPATDIYALGVILYELLTGEPPLRGETDLQTLQLVSQGEIPAIKSRRSGVSRDLAAIVHKCLETTPSRRYTTADDLADDLERFLSGQPTKARPTGAIVRAVKWCRRRPMVAALFAVVLLSATVSAAFGWRYLEQRRIATKAQQDRQQEITQRLYVASMNSTDDALAINYRKQVREHLDGWLPQQGEPDHRSFAWHYLNRQLDEDCLTLAGHSRDIYRVEYSPDGRLLATSSADGTARIWDSQTGQCIRVLRGHTDEVNCVAFHPSGEKVATAGDDGKVIFWNLTTGQQTSAISRSRRRFGVAFHPDGRTFVVCSEAGIGHYDVDTGKSLHVFEGQSGPVGAAAFSKSGKWLAAAAEDGSVLVWEVATSGLRKRLSTGKPANHVAFSDDERWLVASSRTGRRVHLLDLQTMTDRGTVNRSFDWIHSVAFHPSNEYFAVASKDGIVDIVDLASHSVVRRVRGHDTRVWSVAFRPDGKQLATAGADGAFKLWDLTSGSHDFYCGPSGSWARLGLTPFGTAGIALRINGEMLAFDLNRRDLLWQTFADFEVVGDFDGDSRMDGALFQNGTWRLNFNPAASNSKLAVGQNAFVFGSTGDWPVVGDWDGDGRDNFGYYRPDDSTLNLDYDGQGGCPEKIMKLHEDFGTAAVPVSARWGSEAHDSPGVAVYYAGEMKAWSVSLNQHDGWNNFLIKADDGGGQWVPLFGKWHFGRNSDHFGFLHSDRLWSIPLPDRKWVLLDKRVPLRQLQERIAPTFQPVEELPMSPQALHAAKEAGRFAPQSFAVSPDANTVATIYSHDLRVRINDARTGLRLATLQPGTLTPTLAVFDPDGAGITIGTAQGTIVRYDARTFRRGLSLKLHDASISQLFHSIDGRRLASIDSDGDIVISSASGETISTLERGRRDHITSLQFSCDGSICAICSPLRPLSIYHTDTGRRFETLIGEAIDSHVATFSPDGRTLATSGEGGQVLLWDTATWERMFSLPTGDVVLEQLLFGKDGTELVGIGGTSQGELRLLRWRAGPKQVPHRSQRQVTPAQSPLPSSPSPRA